MGLELRKGDFRMQTGGGDSNRPKKIGKILFVINHLPRCFY